MKESKKKSEEAWKFILYSGKILSDGEAEDMIKIIRKSRKDLGFRT